MVRILQRTSIFEYISFEFIVGWQIKWPVRTSKLSFLVGPTFLKLANVDMFTGPKKLFRLIKYISKWLNTLNRGEEKRYWSG